MSKEPIDYLKHIHDESSYILSVITSEKTKDEFLSDETLVWDVVKNKIPELHIQIEEVIEKA